MWLRAVLLSLAVASAASPARAQDPADDAARCLDFGADDADVTARIADIRARIAHHEPDTRHWFTAWSTVFGALLGAELTITFTAATDGARVDGIVSTVSVALGLVTQLIAFPPTLGAGGHLDAMPESSPDERLAKLVVAEQLLHRASDAVHFAQGPIGPILSGLYSIAANSLLLIAFSRTVAAYIGVVGGLILGQGRILSAPDGMAREWRTYRAAHADAGCALPVGGGSAASLDWRVTPTATMGGAGLSFGMTF